MLDSATYTYDQLETKYQHFFAPAFEIEIEGSLLHRQMVPISSVRVSMTTESRADSCQFRIEHAYNAVSREFDWIGSLVEVGSGVVIRMGYLDKLTEVFNGIITGIGIDYPERGSPTVNVTAMDRSVFMMRSQQSNDWVQKKISDVATLIGAKYGLSSQVDATNIVFPVINQFDETDYKFLKKWAAKLAYEFFVVGNTLVFRKPPENASPVMALTYGKNLSSYSVDVDITQQVSQVIVHGTDPKTRERFERTSQQVRIIGTNGRVGSDIINKLSKHMVEHVYENVKSPDSAQLRADAIMHERSLDLVTGQGQCIGLPELRAGRLIKLEGVGPKFSQPMLLSSVTHTIDTSGYSTSFTVKGNAI